MAKRSSDPLAAVCHGRAMQNSGTGSCRDCRRVVLVPGPRGKYSGKKRFIKKPGVQDEEVATCLNVVLTAPAAVRHERARQNLWTGRCGYCRRVLWVPGPRGQYSG